MSQTSTTTTQTVQAVFRYQEPDFSVSPDERCLFSLPKPKNVWEETLPLHDYRTATNLTKGSEGLDKHGFTLVEHHIDTAVLESEESVRKTYIPSVEQLVKNVTGCKTAIVNNVAFRQKFARKYDAEEKFYHPKNGDMDKMLSALPSDVALISPKDPKVGGEPARALHVDYTRKGMLDTVRYCRAEYVEAGAQAIKALDAGQEPPRVAAYSVWRPLKTVTRDPIAVLDHKSRGDISKDFVPFSYRAKGYDGEYLLEAYAIVKPELAEDHAWYHVSEQKPHEVMLIKFADTESDNDPGVAPCCGHGSPFVVGTDDEEPRESVEARVLAFW